MTRKQKAFLEQFAKCGNVTKTCEAVGVGRSTFYQWFKLDERFRQEVEYIRESLIDEVEDHLLAKIREGDTTAIIFFLKTRAKHRGYSEKFEFDQKIDNQILIKIVDDEDNNPQGE